MTGDETHSASFFGGDITEEDIQNAINGSLLRREADHGRLTVNIGESIGLFDPDPGSWKALDDHAKHADPDILDRNVAWQTRVNEFSKNADSTTYFEPEDTIDVVSRDSLFYFILFYFINSIYVCWGRALCQT